MSFLILLFSIFLIHSAVGFARPGAFLFFPIPSQAAPAAILAWVNYGWDISNPVPDSKTFILENRGTASTGVLSTTMTIGSEFNVSADNCVFTILLPGGTCTVVVDYDGSTSGTLYFLELSDGSIPSTATTPMHYCPGC